MIKLSILVAFLLWSWQKQCLSLDFIILPSHYTLKSSISDKPMLDFTPGRKAILGSTDNTRTIATPLIFSEEIAQSKILVCYA